MDMKLFDSVLQMSISGAAFIMAVVLIRVAAIHKLPKKTFLILWELVMVRLLIPFSIPSMFSVYTLVTHNLSSAALLEIETQHNIPAIQGLSVATQKAAEPPADLSSSVSMWFIIWCAGMILLVLFFVLSYLRCLIEFRTALPVHDHAVEMWLEKHPLKRPVLVRQSDRIFAPLTYGIFRPVILMPKKTDWKNEKQLHYVLSHEYVHICRYDTVTKLIAALALCIHWFNPFVWAMYLLFNRDLELACDESVIRQFGEGSKSAYSRMLIDMEAAKSGLLPFCNSFSKNAIEERITAVMKMRKTSLFAICIAAVLIAGVTAAFATSAADSGQKSNTIHSTDFTDAEHPDGTQEDYRSLLDLKTADYRSRSVADFNMDLLEWANEDYERMERINRDIAWQDFSVSLNSDELSFVTLTTWLSGVENAKYVQSNYTGRQEEDPGHNRYLPSKTKEENGYGAWCDLFYQFSYHIADKQTLTVGERDDRIGNMMNGIQDFWNRTDIEEMLSMTEDDIVSRLKAIAAEYSNADITITILEDFTGFEKMDERNRL